MTFLTSSNCDGSSAVIIAAKSCSIPLTTLIVSPFNLIQGASVYAQIIATNAYGDSSTSPVGNGAAIVLVPDAPVGLANNNAVTTQS